MPSNAAAAQPQNIESRKLQLMVRIAQIEDVAMIDMLEEIAFDTPDKSEKLTKEELAVVEKRLEEFRANPNEFVTLEQLESHIKSLQ